MPELPEVEVVRMGLIELILGQNILGLKSINSPKSLVGSAGDISQFAVNSKIIGVSRRGKLLIIELSSSYCLVVHLKMTGQLVYRSSDQQKNFGAGHPTNSLIGKLPDASTRVVITLEKGTLFFNDQRKFGWIRLIHRDQLDDIKLHKTMGPEPLEPIEEKVFSKMLSRRANSRIKPAILDQSVIAGVGNIYADESLWMSQIHPSTRVKDVSEESRSLLLKSIIESMRTSISHGGSTDRNYVNAKGQRGSYMTFAKVFRREGQDCSRCGTEIIKIKLAGRGTHLCPTCQIEVQRS